MDVLRAMPDLEMATVLQGQLSSQNMRKNELIDFYEEAQRLYDQQIVSSVVVEFGE